jgi:hypothetical protein
MTMYDDDQILDLEGALQETERISDEDLDLYNALDGVRFSRRVGEVVHRHKEGAKLRRQGFGTLIAIPRGLSLLDWAASERRHEDPVDVLVRRPSGKPLYVGCVRRDEVRRQTQG